MRVTQQDEAMHQGAHTGAWLRPRACLLQAGHCPGSLPPGSSDSPSPITAAASQTVTATGSPSQLPALGPARRGCSAGSLATKPGST